jgi:DNA-binding response OmpR family regulator
MARDDFRKSTGKEVDGTSPLTQLPDVKSSQAHQSVILVADDEALIRNLVTLLLQQDGHLVLSAANGHEGLELSRRYPGSIDLVITDVDMPRLNGTDLCGHLLKERPGIKVLVMSGADMGEIVSHNINLPFLPKPFDGVAMKERVRAILLEPVRPPAESSSPAATP